MRINIPDARADALPGVKVSLEADMSHPGMKPLFADAAPTSDGSYQAGLNFEMAGDWTLLIHAQLPDGRRVDAERRFTVLTAERR